jgi:hypothetical protein
LQIDLFDYKPALTQMRGTELPASVRRGQRLTGVTATQERFPVAPSKFRFARHGLNATLLHCLGIDHTRLTAKMSRRIDLSENRADERT